MSISLLLVPVALALRVVMGKERFESWIESMQRRIPADFRDEEELVVTVRKAGYDAEHWGGSIKTHIRGEELFFFWDKNDGVWNAIFAKSDPEPEIDAFLRNIEATAGRRIFRLSEQETEPTVATLQTFPTNFRDATLLQTALADYGLRSEQRADGAIECQNKDCHLMFRQDETEPFRVEIHRAPDVREIFQHLTLIHEGYCQNVQAQTYERLKSRVSERGLSIAHEEVLEDNSILITIDVGR